MSKYQKLWEAVSQREESQFQLTFAQIEELAGAAIDHSFLRYKRELTACGYEVGKISMKEKTVSFKRMDNR